MKRSIGKGPVSRDPLAVRARILDAAQAEFMVSGYESASTNRITEAFGGSKATLFRYFPTKEKLLEAVLRRIAGRWEAAVNWRDLPGDTPRAWLEAFGHSVLDWILGEEPLFVGRLAIAEGHRFAALEHVFEETAGDPLESVLAARLAHWHRDGLIKVRYPRHDAVHFLDLVVAGTVSRALYGRKALTVRAKRVHVERAVDLFLNGCARD